MASTGIKYATSAQSVAEAPFDDADWTSTGNALGAPDGTWAGQSASLSSGERTHILKLSGYDFSSIPAGATILGVTVTVRAKYSGSGGILELVQLLDSAGAKVGTDAEGTWTDLTNTPDTYTYGGASDLWGNALTRAWVQDADFGVALGGGCLVNGSYVDIDAVGIEIEYMPPPRTYWVVYEDSATDPADNSTGYGQIIAGQDGDGAAAVAAGYITAPSADAVDEALATITGLSASTTYRAAAVWWDAASDYGAGRILSAGITTSAGGGPPTLTGISASGITSSGATLTITAS